MGKSEIAAILAKMHGMARPQAFRKTVIRNIRESAKSHKVAVLLSGGVDSHVALFGALAAGKSPHIYTFTLAGVESRDFRAARRTADALNLPFTHVELPTDIDHLKKYVWDIFHTYLPEWEVSKTTVECCWPIMHSIDAIKEPYVITGFGGDIPYCSARSAKKMYLAGHYKTYLKSAFDVESKNLQSIFRNTYLQLTSKKLTFCAPLADKKMLKVFDNFDPFKEGNTPIQKSISRAAFWESLKNPEITVYGQQPFQKGDTGIEEHFMKLLDTDWHIRGKTPRAIYNAVAKKEVVSPYSTSIFEQPPKREK